MQDDTIDTHVGVQGRFSLCAGKVDGSSYRKLTDPGNMILDGGFAMLLGTSANDPLLFAHVGGGSTPVSAGQNALVSPVAAIGGTSSAVVMLDTVTFSLTAPYSITRTRVLRFPAGTVNANIAELAMGPTSAPSGLFCRALVTDDEGAPTTVSLEADEFLDMSYALTFYPSTEDSLTTLNLNGTSHSVRLRAAGLSTITMLSTNAFARGSLLARNTSAGTTQAAGAGELVAPTAVPNWTNVTVASEPRAYVPSSFYGETDITFGLNDGNFATGIAVVRISMQRYHGYQVKFDPPIPKTASQLFRFRLRITLARRDAA